MKNPNRRTTDLALYKFTKGLPTKQNCDLTDPKEMFAWMLVALPGQNGGPVAFPSIDYLLMISEHLYECGAQFACEKCGHVRDPEKKYQPPTGSEPNWATTPGRWVEPDEPDLPRTQIEDVWSGMHMLQQAELVKTVFEDEDFWERLPKPYKDQLRRVLDDPT